jgi:hypothetical protein
MNEVILKCPEAIQLYVPRDYTKHWGGDSVRMLDASPSQGLTIRWDDVHLELLTANGGVSYQRSAILGFRVGRRQRVMHWQMCELQVELKDTILPLLYCEAKDEPAFDSLLATLASAGLPIEGPGEGGPLPG